MKLRKLISVLALSVASTVQAEVVDLNKASIKIEYKTGTTPADGLNIKCGPTSGGPYTRSTQVALVTTTVPIQKLIGGAGAWFCVVTDFVQTASGPLEGQGSNEITFFAAVAPSGSIVISIIP